MEKRLWFKAKTYGWGWTPVTWEGWAATFVYAFIVGWAVARMVRVDPELSPMPFVAMSGVVLVATISLIVVCFKKGEKPEWRWGNKK